ncbi:hypothetical protein [Kordia sp.]|uniref:hypothetical protein n=1 Tax=Kordia sp. TaxID=1965332 RepID=UPI003D2BEE3F
MKNEKSILFVGVLIIIFLWLFSGVAISWIVPKLQDRGVIGDMFGAINALFSGLALAFVIYTVYLQSKQLDLQNKEIKNALEETRKTNLVNMYSSLIMFYSNEEEKYRGHDGRSMENAKQQKQTYIKLLKNLEKEDNNENT